MVVHYFDIVRISVLPPEANAPLLIDPDTVLPDPVPSERFKAVSLNSSQIVKTGSRMKPSQPFSGRSLNALELAAAVSLVECFCFRAPE